MNTKAKSFAWIRTLAVWMGWIAVFAVNIAAAYELNLIILAISAHAHILAPLWGYVFFAATFVADILDRGPEDDTGRIKSIIGVVLPIKALLQAVFFVTGFGIDSKIGPDTSFTAVFLSAFHKDIAAVIFLFFAIWVLEVLAKALLVEQRGEFEPPPTGALLYIKNSVIHPGSSRDYHFTVPQSIGDDRTCFTCEVRDGSKSISVFLYKIEYDKLVFSKYDNLGDFVESGYAEMHLKPGDYKMRVSAPGWTLSRKRIYFSLYRKPQSA